MKRSFKVHPFESSSSLFLTSLCFLVENSPQGAAVPALGLSNKPVYHVEEQKETKDTSRSDQYSENYFVATHLDGKMTLWIEQSYRI